MLKENKFMDKKNILSQLYEARQLIENCISEFSKTDNSTRKAGRALPKISVKTKTRPKLNFGLNERNFIKTYAKGLSGRKKFVLLLAKITKGKIGTDAELKLIRSKWNKMKSKSLMGYEFNLNYPTEAKTQGWVDSKKSENYHLCDGWMKIFD